MVLFSFLHACHQHDTRAENVRAFNSPSLCLHRIWKSLVDGLGGEQHSVTTIMNSFTEEYVGLMQPVEQSKLSVAFDEPFVCLT